MGFSFIFSKEGSTQAINKPCIFESKIMISLEEFRAKLKTDTIEDLVTTILLSDEALHVSDENLSFISRSLSSVYGVQESEIDLWVVGSAKLGFSLVPKKQKDGPELPRYRSIRADSDIDIAVVSRKISEIIWNELSGFAHGFPAMPWNSGRLGDYMIYGWFRPDFFPKGRRLRKCDDWFDLFRRLSANVRFGRRQVRGGLFYSIEHLKRYQTRALRECIQEEGMIV